VIPVQASKDGSQFWVAQDWQVAELGSAMHWNKHLEAVQVLNPPKQAAQVAETPVLFSMQVTMQLESALH
jgi:hypothetical protein